VIAGEAPAATASRGVPSGHEGALVRVNGNEIARASVPPFLVDISAALSAGDNSIEIDVLAPPRNHFVGRALAGDERYTHMQGYGLSWSQRA